jgi:cyclophilin family peptidyl-prolyl cis-trans isomerase
MLAMSRQVIARLRASAVAEYRAAPNQNPDVTRTLMGILSNDVRTDDYQAAAELARVLMENKCSDTALWDLAGKAAYCVDDFDSAEVLLRKAGELDAIDEAGRNYLKEMPALKQKWRVEEGLRAQEGATNDLPRVKLFTTKGDILIELFENEAPQTVGNFISLCDAKFYDGLTFHRVLPGFMAQAGCPNGNGTGGPGYTIYDECTKENHRNHFSGSLSMAKTALPNTGGSQFFLTFRPTPHLDGKHTVFGRVVEGFEILSRLERVDPTRPSRTEPDRIVRAQVIRRRPHTYEATKVRAP